MAKTPATYPVGSRVRVMQYGIKPGGWTGDMFNNISGKDAVISHVTNVSGAYRYTLEGYPWTWRHCDLVLLELPKGADSMKLSDIYPSLRVRIINWEENGGKLPPHWAGDGLMDIWQDKVVTIRHVDVSTSSDDRNYIYILEDKGRWTWYSSDFKPACTLATDNPNNVWRKNRRRKMG